ncbi:hypothetical protein CK203_054047 [Vitis vinifera]|uniref:Integrase catalytic domain-containing protein n=1 Tax=Vitis vinifera TaxID=29760 RepID=A0A438GIP6_VITVI|nr:hypothetical protein CK203_054047 [Vitis vinifera]
MRAIPSKVRDTLQQFFEWTVEKIKRAENGCADALADIATSLHIKEAILLPIHVQANPSVAEIFTCNTIEAKTSRRPRVDMNDYYSGTSGQARLPEDPKQAHKIRAPGPSHSGHGHSRSPYQPHPPKRNFCSSPQITSVNGWKLKHMLGIKDKDVTKFVWKNIIRLFEIPQTIIADNGPQFDSIAFRNFCSELNIRNSYSTPCYPQSNGQAEATNKTLITALKKSSSKPKENGGGATRRPMGLSNHTRTPTRNTSLRPHIWYGCNHFY